MANQDYKYKDIGGLMHKRCSRCREYKPITNEYYPKGSDTKYGIRAHCKMCEHKPKFNYPNFNEQGLLYCRKCEDYKNTEEFSPQPDNKSRNGKHCHCRFCNRKANKKFREDNKGEDLERHVSKIVSVCKDRSKKDKFLEFEFNLDIIFIKQLLKEQKGKCKISGLNMTYFINNGHSKNNISIDRIDSSRGYTKDNVQLVCLQVNIMKSNLTDEELFEMCRIIYTNLK